MRDVLTRQQALARGITASAIRHRLARGTWRRLHPGVYLTHGGDLTWRHRVTAAVLARGDGAVVSLDCALRLWNLENREPPIITLAEPTTTHRVRPLPGVRVRRRRRLATARRYDIPVTSLPQTLLDVLAQPGRTTDDAMALVTRAVARRRVTVAALREELTHHPRHPRRTLLEEVFRAAEDGLESVAEARYVEHVEQPHGLPTMQRQVAVDGPAAVADGRSRRLDFWDEERGIGMEIDGELFHRERQVQDRSRDREAASNGVVILRAGWVEVVDRPCELAVDVALTQMARGWTGRPRACGPACAVGRDRRLR